jgi:predicted nuclease of predicted toxin-antitoxin system
MWLLDANVDVHLASLLREFGIPCETAASRGWKALTNGDLVTAAVAAGFDCILTRDQTFAESASTALKSSSNFALVVVTLSQEPWPQYRRSFLDAWAGSPIQPVAGRLIHWP